MFGHKTDAWLDIWSLQHIFFGLLVSAFLGRRLKKCGPKVLLLAIAAEYSWEVVEFHLETGHAGRAIAVWFAGQEFIGNRLLVDHVLTCSLGYLLCRLAPQAVSAARVMTLVWWSFHIAVAPDCMYLMDPAAWRQWTTWSFLGCYFGGGIMIFAATSPPARKIKTPVPFS